MRARTAAQSVAGRDISPLPKVKSGRRKSSCAKSFRKFCDTYFKDVFDMAWSKDHEMVIGKIETAVLDGGLFAMAMPRGSGKTSLCETAALWSILYGHRQFICLIGASEDAATQMLDSIKAEIISYEDYVQCGGESGSKEKGKLRLEGKEYIVKDGDVIHFKFNV